MNYRRRANAVLSLVFVLFIFVSWAKHLWPDNFILRLCQFVLEASLVGGIADWFAVTALFRKPLGWPYHTALIPRNRTKMIESIRAMVETELLSEILIRQKIEQLRISEKMLLAVEKRGGAGYLTEKLAQLLAGLKDHVSTETIAVNLATLIRVKTQGLGLPGKLLEYSRRVITRQEFDQWLNERIEDSLIYVSGSQVHTLILDYLENLKEQQLASGGFLQRTLFGVFQAADGVNFDAAADSLQMHLILNIRRMKQFDHPLRIRLKSQFEERLMDWKMDGLTEGHIEEWLSQVLSGLSLEASLEKGVEKVLNDWQDGKSLGGENLVSSLEPFLNRFWSIVQEDEALRTTIDGFFRDTLLQVVQKEHRLIGDIVEETLEGLSNDELNQFIEDKAGNDLQWIRINGSIVGGIIGFILFFVLNYGYQSVLMIVK